VNVLRALRSSSASYANLLEYPLFYFFSATMGFAPHEIEFSRGTHEMLDKTT
jgi:hypothetical protein